MLTTSNFCLIQAPFVHFFTDDHREFFFTLSIHHTSSRHSFSRQAFDCLASPFHKPLHYSLGYSRWLPQADYAHVQSLSILMEDQIERKCCWSLFAPTLYEYCCDNAWLDGRRRLCCVEWGVFLVIKKPFRSFTPTRLSATLIFGSSWKK